MRTDRERPEIPIENGVAVRRRVRDSGCAHVAARPAAVSTTIGCFSVPLQASPMRRPTVSIEPPGTNGMTILMGRLGKS